MATAHFSLGNNKIDLIFSEPEEGFEDTGWARPWLRRKYSVKVQYHGRETRKRMTVPYNVGEAFFTNTVEELGLGLLRSLAQDQTDEYGPNDVAEFLADMGYDRDSHKGWETFHALLKQQAEVKRVFGPDLDAFVLKFKED